ncbi:tRNA lysidine(34) synthetase TilS [Salipaludibacillus sp. CF4.18]|uniref:tRNA lysidine(34) synthetase TilS n=1 Tax=Salipaludibacillus sp. CF4.18 TaxID=3373081 RepID=UPI003EE530AA
MNPTIELFISRHELIKTGDHLLIAVSGGPDSMALLDFLIGKQMELELVLSIAHVEHGLRGEASKKDADFVRDFCEARNLPFFLHEPDVLARKQQDRSSIQQAARACRYDWFALLMQDLNADKLVFGHHGDDQIETMLMRQIRGSLSGRKGMPVKRSFSRGEIIRPFLCVDKNAILDYCAKKNIPYRLDLSNEKDDYQRNRIRHHLLPFIKEENSKAHEVFQWQSEALTEEEEWLQGEAEKRLHKITLHKAKYRLTINKDDLLSIPIALQRRVIHLILNYMTVSKDSSFDRHHIKAVQKLLESNDPAASLSLPGFLQVEKSYKLVDFSFSEEGAKPEETTITKQPLTERGVFDLPLGRLEMFSNPEDGMKSDNETRSSMVLDCDKVQLPLFVRSRENGDRISIIGSEGTKKLKDLFIDHKIPRRDRGLWPIITDSHGTILWVPFLRRSSEALIDKKSVNILQIAFTFYT